MYYTWTQQEELPEAQRTRGAVLRDTCSRLGPFFVKTGQTLSQRADIVGEEAAAELKDLQQSNAPFPNAVAYAVIIDEFNAAGVCALPLLLRRS
jgi:predicted unusual protein kinase regulating ubiquinone biosynthesis (AarF/ABC1/UbiB family)